MRHTLIALLGVMLIAGCASGDHVTAPDHSVTGQPFMPVYLVYLQTGQFPHDDSCEPTDLHTLLVPCDG